MRRSLAWILYLLPMLLVGQAAAQVTIAATADLHVNPVVRGTSFVNPLEPIHMQITDAFLWDAAQQGADVVLLLGDNTNQGRLAQHQALIPLLQKAEEAGCRVLVLPGNHDIGEVSAQQFAELYADFGYEEAYSRDPSSLSYSVLLGDHLLLMLDTGGYASRNQTAELTQQTLTWMRSQLELAQRKGWPVMAAGHYPLITEQACEFIGKEEALRLFEAYGVQLYLSGHLHKRCVTLRDGLTELVVDQAVAYPCAYALLTADDEGGYRYQPRSIAMSQWAGLTGQSDPNLAHFDAYQTRLERERYRNIVQQLKRDSGVTPKEQQLAEDFFWSMMDARAQGTLSRYADALSVHPGCEIMIRLAEGTIYHRWIPAVLADAVPYTAGFVLTDGEIRATDEEE